MRAGGAGATLALINTMKITHLNGHSISCVQSTVLVNADYGTGKYDKRNNQPCNQQPFSLPALRAGVLTADRAAPWSDNVHQGM